LPIAIGKITLKAHFSNPGAIWNIHAKFSQIGTKMAILANLAKLFNQLTNQPTNRPTTCYSQITLTAHF
jgi:hypothetical protein